MTMICLITTGGTIASKKDAASGHVTAGVEAKELRNMLQDPLEGITVVVEEFRNIGSYAMDLAMAFELASLINEKLADPACDGVVVTHGTDTMEESAYMADLLAQFDKPIVFTGAQRAADEPAADGPRNIADAIRIAAAPQVRGLGALISFEQEFHAARDATKSHASRVDSFISAEHGKLGEIDGDKVIVHRRPTIRKNFAVPHVVEDVELVKIAMGTTGRYLRFAADNGAKAIVIEGFGRGNATPSVTDAAIELVRRGIPVIMTSRCQRGRVKPIYGNGGGKTLFEGGVIFAGDLSGQKARVLTSVLLGLDLDTKSFRDEIEQLAG